MRKPTAFSCALLLASAPAFADPMVFVNVAQDGLSGQHTLKVMREAVSKNSPEAPLKSSVVLEEPVAHTPPGPKQILAEVNRLLNEGKAAYNRSNLDGATEAIAQAEAMAMSTEPLPETFEALAELERLNGLIALKQKDPAAADEAFKNAFTLKPELASLDSSMGVYARMLKSKDRGQGQVVIKAEPMTAWVSIDGAKAQTGTSAPLEAGTHFVAASREGYLGQIQRVTVPKGKVVPVSFVLPEATNESELVVARANVSAAAGDASRALSAKKIAELMKTRFVVLVRPDDAALYDTQTFRLGAFEPIEKAVQTATQALRGEAPRPLITDAEVKAAEVRREEAAVAAQPSDWYKKPWAIATGAVLLGGIIAGVTAGIVVSSNKPPTYSFSSWCHASDCPPLN
ncbi:MAG: PEGA domain-containing protein [Archangiaceae bacterium]|nr:PEGA domain-containing protein [Archangiaceae bacterium]